MKIAICTPVYQDPSWVYTKSLGEMLTRMRGAEFHYLTVQGRPHAVARQMLAQRAMDLKVDLVLWLDADHSFPTDTLARLIRHKLAFVGCNYARRQRPTGPTAVKIENGAEVMVWTTAEKAKAGEVEQVGAMGLGVCLVHRTVFEAVPQPWFDGHAEDTNFCNNAAERGFFPHVDHALSWEIGHVRQDLVTNLDTLTDRDQWTPGDPTKRVTTA